MARAYIYIYLTRGNITHVGIDISILRRKTPTKGESTSVKRELFHSVFMKYRLNMNGVEVGRRRSSELRRKSLVRHARSSSTIPTYGRCNRGRVCPIIDQSRSKIDTWLAFISCRQNSLQMNEKSNDINSPILYDCFLSTISALSIKFCRSYATLNCDIKFWETRKIRVKRNTRSVWVWVNILFYTYSSNSEKSIVMAKYNSYIDFICRINVHSKIN